MRILLAEDDFASRKFMGKLLAQYGECDETVDGEEASDAFAMAMEDGQPYELVCLDVMMPVMDGYQVLQSIREMEEKSGIPETGRAKIIMVTALNEENSAKKAENLANHADAHVGKPIDVEKFEQVLRGLKLI